MWTDFDISVAALCAWREARGEGHDGIRAVIHVISNRAKLWRKSWAQVVYQPMQFSSMTYPHDPQLTKVPQEPDVEFDDCREVASLIYNGGDFDLTNGATHYYATYIEAPEWTKSMRETAKIGQQVFYV